MDNITSLRLFWPESVLTVATVAMFIQDLFVRRSPRRVGWLVSGAIFWLAVTALATWATPWGDTPLFGGLLQHALPLARASGGTTPAPLLDHAVGAGRGGVRPGR